MAWASPTCLIHQSKSTVWALGQKEITAINPKNGKWLATYRLNLAQKTCPKVLKNGNGIFVLLKGQWVVLTTDGEVLDEGKWEGAAQAFTLGQRFWVLGPGPDGFLDLDFAKAGKPKRILPLSGPGVAGKALPEKILLSSEKVRPPHTSDLLIMGRAPSPYTETVGAVSLSNREFNKSSIRFEFSAGQLFGARSWQLDLDGTANWLAIYDGFLLVQKDQGHIGAWKLATGFQEQWFSPFDFRLGRVRVKTSGRQPYLEEEDSGIQINFDVAIDIPLGSVGTLYLLKANDFVSSIEWVKENSLIIQPDLKRSQTAMVMSERFVARAKEVGTFVRPERAMRVGLPIAVTRLVVTGDGGLLGFSADQAIWVTANNSKPQFASPLKFKKAVAYGPKGKAKLPEGLSPDLFP